MFNCTWDIWPKSFLNISFYVVIFNNNSEKPVSYMRIVTLWIACVTLLMNKNCRTIFPFSWEVVIFLAITKYLPNSCSKYWTLLQHKCTNLVYGTRATRGLHFYYDFIYFIIFWGLDVKIFQRFLKLFHSRWYVEDFGGFRLMASFHKMFPTIIFTKSR